MREGVEKSHPCTSVFKHRGRGWDTRVKSGLLLCSGVRRVQQPWGPRSRGEWGTTFFSRRLVIFLARRNGKYHT